MPFSWSLTSSQPPQRRKAARGFLFQSGAVQGESEASMYEKYLLPLTVTAGAWTASLWWNLRRRGHNRLARPGTVYACSCCGKRSRDHYGTQPIDHGWDESCMMNCYLVRENSIELNADGRVAKAVAA
jgi:hypothetical protein